MKLLTFKNIKPVIVIVLLSALGVLSPSLFVATHAQQISTQICPTSFYDVSIHSNGKLCQVFAQNLPASMIYHVAGTPEEIAHFYQQSGVLSSAKIKGRTMLQSSDKRTILMISADGDGTQVDILVKS